MPGATHAQGSAHRRQAAASRGSVSERGAAEASQAGAVQVGQEVLLLEEMSNSFPTSVNRPEKLAKLLRKQGAAGVRVAGAAEVVAALRAGRCGTLVVPNLSNLYLCYQAATGPPFSAPADAAALKHWVEAGGTLILTADEGGHGEHVGAGKLLELFGITWRNTRILRGSHQRSPTAMQLVPAPCLPWPDSLYVRSRLMTAVPEGQRLYSHDGNFAHSVGVPVEEQGETVASVAAAAVGQGLVASIGMDLLEYELARPVLYALVERAHGLDRSRAVGEEREDPEELLEEELEERAANHGFTRDEVEELLCQGVRPWDPEAWDVMEVLRGGYEDPGPSAYNIMRLAHTGRRWQAGDGYDSDSYAGDSISSGSWESLDSEELEAELLQQLGLSCA